ncbi:MAG: TonB-dependent receptor plug domain-containing protein, partial [Flavobacteriales bacterium]
MKNASLFVLCILLSGKVFSQTGELKGVVKDANSGELLYGAMVELSNGKKASCDENGFYSITSIPQGEYTVTVSAFNYDTTVTTVKIKDKPVLLNVLMQPFTLNEVEIVSNVAKIRETPVAFSNISGIKLQEDLASRDLPMVLNSTPGAYATEQGGGSGDARVTIRGFDQRNVAVMVDGVPVNDMENGWVYWSNWDGLGDATRSIQVQRGLGASRLAITSVGGTMNIITRGIESKRQFSIKQEYGNN